MKKSIIKLLKNWLSKLEKPKYEGRTHIYTDKKGNAFYIKNPTQHHGSRRVAIQAVIDQMGRGIDNLQLFELIAKCSNEITEGDRVQAIGTLANIQARTADIASLKLLYQGALFAVYMDGEPDEKSKIWEDKKHKLWQADEDARFFFMKSSLENLQELPISSETACRNLIQNLELNSETKYESLLVST